MSEGKLIIKINRQGDVTIDAQGFQGEACLEKSRSIISRLGGQVTGQTLKPEYNEQDMGQGQELYE